MSPSFSLRNQTDAWPNRDAIPVIQQHMKERMGSIVRARDGYVLFVRTPSSIHRFYRFPIPFCLLSSSCELNLVAASSSSLRSCSRSLPKTFSVRLCLHYDLIRDAPCFSLLLAWLGSAVLDALPLLFTLTRLAAFYTLAFCHSTFDPQASYGFLVVLLSPRSERALFTVSRYLDSTRVIRDDFSGGVPFIAFQPEFPYSSSSLHCLHAFSSLSRELQLDRSFIALVFDFLGWSVPVLSTLAARLEYSGLAPSWKYFPFTFTSSTSDLGPQASSPVKIA